MSSGNKDLCGVTLKEKYNITELSKLSIDELAVLESNILKSRKYKLCLSYVNSILSKLNKAEIKELTEFYLIINN